MNHQKQASTLFKKLQKAYPDAHCALHFEGPFQLLVATILSAQCNDNQVNKVTPHLFKRFPDATALAQASLEEIEEMIYSTGFYRNKALHIKEMANQLVTLYGGKVPSDMEELVKLSGVGRKTANVVLGNFFFKAVGIVVDTHVSRLSHRLGLSQAKNPLLIEKDLMSLFPQKNWTLLSHLLISHGRGPCNAKKPRCQECFLKKECPSFGL